MSRILYYLVLKPVSLLPFGFLYLLSDLLYFLLYRLLGFRTGVVRGNMRRSFPQATEAQLRPLERRFYRHFTDLLLETIKLFSISREALQARCTIENPEIFHEPIRKQERIIITSGHYANWEMAAQSLSLATSMQLMGIYSPIKDPFMDRMMRESRGKFGMELVSSRKVDAAFRVPCQSAEAFLFATDQAPSNPHKAYWTWFLHQETPVFFGAEKYAKAHRCPVYYAHYTKLRRGHYRVRFELLIADPEPLGYGEVTKAHVRRLEEDIRACPEWWLWSHRRWKRTRPAEVPIHALREDADPAPQPHVPAL